MRSYNRMLIAATILIIALAICCNIYLFTYSRKDGERYYRVEAKRIAEQIANEGLESLELSNYRWITAIYPLAESDRKDFFEKEGEYLIREIKGELYRMEYTTGIGNIDRNIFLIVNIVWAVLLLFVVGIWLFFRQKIVLPFHRLADVPIQLSKGNLTVPVKESKNKFFGKFLWGLDLLRETIEEQKKRELDLQRENKSLVLSISHDIKTPLSAIKLYAKAISKGLYSGKEKEIEIADNINSKADEIEKFVSEIVRASRENFLGLEVDIGEFYLSKVVQEISHYYKEKLGLVRIDFVVHRYSDCLLRGDIDRSIEVVQNLIENAIKYGDGCTIEVLFSEEEDFQLVTVKNSGCTLSEAEMPHIFESFWRGSNVGSNTGNGMGLFICRQLMRKMGGEIFAEEKDSDMYVTAVFQRVSGNDTESSREIFRCI